MKPSDQSKHPSPDPYDIPDMPDELTQENKSAVWSEPNQDCFKVVHSIKDNLKPGFYKPSLSQNIGVFLEKIKIIKNEDFVELDPTAHKVTADVEHFWNSKEKFKKFGFTHKRGILLYGPPGTGKSTVNTCIIENVIKKNGFALVFHNPSTFSAALTMLRSKHKEAPVVAIMEDIDSLIKLHDASSILNILDGIGGFENIVYIATTNYPENLEERFSNRPSRFDKRYHIGYPKPEARKKYFQHLASRVSDLKDADVNIDWLVKNSEKFTIAHLKELFISIAIFENSKQEALNSLKKMGKGVSSDDDADELKGLSIGFGNHRKKKEG